MTDKSAMSSNGTGAGYSVEARIVEGAPPYPYAGQIFDNNWRTVHFTNSNHGVKRSSYRSLELEMMGLFGYQAAQALRWWFIANAESYCGLETRLVLHDVRHAISALRREPCEVEPQDRPFLPTRSKAE